MAIKYMDNLQLDIIYPHSLFAKICHLPKFGQFQDAAEFTGLALAAEGGGRVESAGDPTMSNDSSTVMKASTSDHSASMVPAGIVVGILNRGWRDYVCTYVVVTDSDSSITDGVSSDESNAELKPKSEVAWILVTPWDRRIPRIRIHTTQASRLSQER
ncbi:unnamed protein product [Protopolystoma xenopodis]|uniref:Uncharacterized protein n=1 Tax=Protopolystoma xenopodis TaxID=117903 RepID=A0A3S5ADI1_9PLAT|nr:unnamed protein product [Protopolystoma xenopodis]